MRAINRGIYLIILIVFPMILSLSFDETSKPIEQNLLNLKTFNNETNIEPSSPLNWINSPSFSERIFNPNTFSNTTNNIIYSFSVNKDAIFQLDVFSYYEPIIRDGLFTPNAVYFLNNGTWLVLGIEEPIGGGFPQRLWLGIGENAEVMKWSLVTTVNATSGFAIAANSESIRIIYAEKEINKTLDSDPVLYVKSQISHDWGKTWIENTLLDCSIYPENSFFGFSMVANDTDFIGVWSFSDVSINEPELIKFNRTSLWVTYSNGNEWMVPNNYTLLPNIRVTAPKVFLNQSSGELFLSVNQFSEGNSQFQPYLYRYGNGIHTSFSDFWILGTWISTYFIKTPVIYCDFDEIHNVFNMVNLTDFSEDGIFNASAWKGAFTSTISFPTSKSANYFNLFSNDGPKLFSSDIKTIYNTIIPRGGILSANFPFKVDTLIDSVNSGEIFNYIFNGMKNEVPINARGYLFTLNVTNSTEILTSEHPLGVDTKIPEIEVNQSHNVISPTNSFSSFDEFNLSISANKFGSYMFSVRSLFDAYTGFTNLTDGLTTLFYPSLCRDRNRVFLFFVESDGIKYYIMLSKSEDLGISWSKPKAIFTSTNAIVSVKSSIYEGKLHCWFDIPDISESWRLTSFDQGSSFISTRISDSIAAVSEDSVCWKIDYEFSSPTMNISRSVDFGMNWNLFLSLPQNGNHYALIEKATFDPDSEQYGFLFINSSFNGIRFVLSTNDGFILDDRENLGAGLKDYQQTYQNLGALSLHIYKNQNQPIWSIYSSLLNSEPGFDQVIGVRNYYINGSISDWENITDSNGNEYITGPQFTWSAIVNELGELTLAKLIINPNPILLFTQLQVHYNSHMVYYTEKSIRENEVSILKFNGIASNGMILKDGKYIYEFIFRDRVFHEINQFGEIIIDNTSPSLAQNLQMEPNQPIPRYNTSINCVIEEVNNRKGHLYYKNSENADWIILNMTETRISDSLYNYSTKIPSQDTQIVYWKIEIIDQAGNTLIIDDNGMPFRYHSPRILLIEEKEPPQVLDLNIIKNHEIRIIISEDRNFVQSVVILFNTNIDSGDFIHSESMNETIPGVFSYNFSTFSKEITQLKYTIIAIDIFGNEIPLGKEHIIMILPAMPEWRMDSEQKNQYFISFGILGLVCVLLYQRSSSKQTIKFGNFRSTEIDAKDWHLTLIQKKVKSKRIHNFLQIIYITPIIGIFWLIYSNFNQTTKPIEENMLFYLYLFGISMFLWILAMNRIGIKILGNRDEKIKPKYNILIFTLEFAILLSLVAFIYIGEGLPWWKIRVNKVTYDFAGIQIPELLITLLSTFITSILLLTFSIFNVIISKTKELREEEIRNNNPQLILSHEREVIEKIQGEISSSAIGFIAIIIFTFLFSSDLIIYIWQFLYILIPFIVGILLGMLFIAIIKKRSKKKEHIAINLNIDCPYCHSEISLGSTYCEMCGEILVKKLKIQETEICTHCKSSNLTTAKFCNRCGETMKINKKLQGELKNERNI